jgi:quinol monooxygenase YgiN
LRVVERSSRLARETPDLGRAVKAVRMAATNDLLEQNMSKLALYVPLEAKPGKEKEVAEFLKSALPLVDAEPGTVSWFAIQNGPSSFAIFDTFDDENGRNAHLSGKVAAALMAKAGELLAKPPAIHRIDILADKLPKK